MSMGMVYVALVLSMYITNTCAIRNVVRASQQSSQSTLTDSIPSDAAPVVSAVLVECPKELEKSDQRSQSEQHGPRCEEQLMINIRVNPSFQVEKSEKFLILDEVYDPRKRTKAKILSPYLIEISRGEPIMMYPLQFTKSVKSDQLGSKSKSTETSNGKSDKTSCHLAKPGSQNLQGGYSQNSFNKGMAKVSNTYSKAESNSNKDIESDPRKVVAINNKLYRNTAFVRNSPTDVRTTYDIYDTEDDKEEEFKQNLLPVSQNTIVRKPDMSFHSQSRMEWSDEDNGYEDHSQEQESINSKDVQCQRPSLANVGVSNQISSKLEDSHLAQLGLVKSSRNNKETSTVKLSNCDENMKTQDIENPSLNSNQEDKKNKNSALYNGQIGIENDHLDYSMFPPQEAGSLQEVAETNDEMAEYNDEINPISFELRSSGGRKSFRKFKGGKKGRKRGRQRKNKKEGSRKIDSYEKGSGLEVDEEKTEYDGRLHNAAQNNENPEAHQNYRNTEVEPESNGSYEEEETGDSLQSYKKINDRPREDAFEYPEGNLDENYGEILKKQHVPVGENFDYMEENQPQAEPVEFKKRNEDHKKYAMEKLRNEGGYHYVDGNRNRNNHRNNAGYLQANRIHFGPSKDNGNSRNWGYHNTFGPQKKMYEQLTEVGVSTEYYPNTFEYNGGKNLQGHKNAGKEFGNDYSRNDNNSNGDDIIEDNTNFGHPTSDHNNYLMHTNMNEHPENSETSVEFTPLLSKVLVDWSDGELDVDSNIRHKQRNKYQKSYLDKPLAILQSPRNQAKLLLNNEPSMYLPKKPPFSKVIDDPNLNLGDKLGIMDIIEPRSEKSEIRHKEFSRELLNSYLMQPTPSLIPLTTTSTEKSKAKRSFMLYDDMEMRDTLLDNDYNFEDTYPHKSLPTVPRNTEDDPAPCATCGGKGKKPNSKVPAFNPQENSCRCRNQRTACNCESGKIVRSVSDAWYSVFNMSAPLPFLTTEVRVFRKRRKTWWQIAPSITLNSLSGIFANANLSILFSSHVDIFQLEKSLQLQNHQLLIPKDQRTVRQNQNVHQSGIKYCENKQTTADTETQNLMGLNLNPNNILAIESSKFGFNLIPVQASNNRGEEPVGSGSDVGIKSEILRPSRSAAHSKKIKKPTVTDAKSQEEIKTIGELGYFPTSMNLLERCPNDKNRLCLNMLEDRVPAYTIKVKLPFRENALIQRNAFKVKIDRIITDATTKDVLQVSVDVINEGFVVHDFSIGVYNCPLAKESGKNSKQQLLSPYIAETTTFLLPLVQESYKKHKKFYCDVIVKDLSETKSSSVALNFAAAAGRGERAAKKPEKEKVVSARTLTVEVERRCFCIWECNCHCVPKLESYVDFKVCQKLAKSEGMRSGMISCEVGDKSCHSMTDRVESHSVSQYESKSRGGFGWYMHYALMFLLIMLLLGVIKATVGRFAIRRVDSWGYGYVQPGSSYGDASKCRRFCVNTFFFIVFPFLFWCKCFTPSEEDLLVASTEWQLSLIQDSRGGSEEDDNDKSGYTMTKSTDEDEDVILSQAFDVGSKVSDSSNRASGGEDFINLDARLSDWTLAFNEGIFDNDDDADEEANTKFVLQALVESRESLKNLLLCHTSQRLDVEDNPEAKLAEDLVSSFKSARIVYRIFDRPVGNVRNIPPGKRYCIQGYFLPSLGTEYEFVNYCPLAQHRCFSARGSSIEVLRPPVILCPQEFSHVYKNKLDVLKVGDLSVHPPANTPCINITTLAYVATSVAKLASEDNSYRSHSHLPFQADADRPYYSPFSCARQPLWREKEEEEEKERGREEEEYRTDFVQPTFSELALHISSMNDDMMNETTELQEEEFAELLDNSRSELNRQQLDRE